MAARAFGSMKMRPRRRVFRNSRASACVATATPQPMSTHGNQSVPGVSQRLMAAQMTTPAEMGEEDAHGEVVEHMTRLSEMTGFVRNDRFRKKIPKI